MLPVPPGMSARICRFVKTVGPAAAAAPETGAAGVRGGGAAPAPDSVTDVARLAPRRVMAEARPA